MPIPKSPKESTSISVSYDGKLSLAIGKSRLDKSWKNREISWSELLEKLSRTTRTRETFAEYQKMSRAKKGEIKDVGGFVGGVLAQGRRTAESVTWRSLVTLDADYATPELWDQICMVHDYAMAVYSTHSHSKDKPRLRLVIPLARPVTPDEYGAISRRLADNYGIDLFDDSTYEPNRLMYWPSTADDGDWVFDHQDGQWLDPEEVLATYADWRDQSTWPESSRETTKRKKLADRQGDPHEKPGLIGAFCRAHSIPDVIELFLQETYTHCDIDNRYTFVSGSTSAGLVVYEDGKFAYSHHGTDPTGGILCNAFDLVRIHKFGHLDEDLPETVPHNRLPSYSAMQEFAGKDAATRIELAAEKDDEILIEFGEEQPDMAWKANLEYTKQGKIVSTIENAVIILENDYRLKGKLKYNEFAARYEVHGKLPWRDGDKIWDDADDAGLRYFLEKHYGLSGSTKIADAVDVVMMKHRYHPVRDYLEGLSWDGELRIDTLLADYLGVADNTTYVQAVTRKTLVAAVKRVYQPGCKFDYVLTLHGPQGIGKTSLLRKLGMTWMQENMPTMEGKEAMEQLRGFWLIELGELNAVRRSEQEAVKGFLTRQIDSYRVPYGKRLADFPRQCIFIANTNESNFLNDPTGGRRYWPVTVTGKPNKSTGWQGLSQDTVDQIWAEAVYWYGKKEEVYLDTDELQREATKHQKRVRRDSDKYGLVEEYLNIPLPENWYSLDLVGRRLYLSEEPTGFCQRDRVCALEILAECLGMDPGKIRRQDSDEIHTIMTSMDGWKKYEKGTGKMKFGRIYGPQRAYVREQ